MWQLSGNLIKRNVICMLTRRLIMEALIQNSRHAPTIHCVVFAFMQCLRSYPFTQIKFNHILCLNFESKLAYENRNEKV